MSSPKPPTPKHPKQATKKNTALSPWAWVFVVLGGLVLLGSLWGAYKFYMWWNPPAKYERDFSLQWDEEVKLHDGRMIVVNIKRKFRRQYLHLEYERVWYLGTQISFDAGEPWGRYTRYFQGYDVRKIENYDEKWYFTLVQAHPGSGPDHVLVSEMHPTLIVSHNDERPAKNWSDIPAFPIQNILPVTPNVAGISEFNGKHLDWDEKIKYWFASSSRGEKANKSLIRSEQPKIKNY